jgi:uncharacterized protein
VANGRTLAPPVRFDSHDPLDKIHARCFIDSTIPGADRDGAGATQAFGEQDREDVMALTHSDAIEVKRIQGKGRGVFARRVIREGEVIERVPVLVLPRAEAQNGSGSSRLSVYCFEWGRGTVAVALGYGSLYNHSYKPNARYDDESAQTKVFTAIREIAAGEEITVNYNGEPEDGSPVWFKVLTNEKSQSL